uniref:Uncharacterized protein n=1 Tax=Setaria italica TaxID=4555 RepID=K3ZG91_SETIT
MTLKAKDLRVTTTRVREVLQACSLAVSLTLAHASVPCNGSV